MASIHKLSPEVVNRIAAGEVVQRPSAALKELLENAIDAGCGRIQVLVADGGLEALQVGDDGSGIHREDLPLLCERYATSKLQSFEDLHRVTSFGFRGEALASISYVSRVTVTTRRRPPSPTEAPSASSSSSAQVAWRAQYLNGSLTADPQPCAGNIGTTIRAEKLFYNALVRRNSLRASEEWGRIVDVVSRYALAYPRIGFTCQQDPSYGGGGGAAGAAFGSGGGSGGGPQGSGGGGVSFAPNSTTRQNIRLSHGHHIVSHLRLVYAYEVGAGDAAADGGGATAAEEGSILAPSSSSSSDEPQHTAAQEARVFAQMERRAHHVRSAVGAAGEGLFTVVGYTSDPTLTQRKPYLCLFINQRLVESTAIRKAIDSVYSGVLTGGNRSFTVLFVTVPTDRLDVNVHPTKKEVFLLDEELIVARVSEVCRGAVLEAAAARQMDMLKMRHTTALALKQMPAADGTGGVESGDAHDLSGSSSQHILEKLRDQHRRGAPMASPLTSSSAAAAAAAAPSAAPGGGSAVVVAPCTMVRVEPQRGALDRFFSQRLASTAASAAAPAATEVREVQVVQSAMTVDSGTAPLPTATPRMREQGETPEARTARRGTDASATAEGVYEAPSWDTVMASLHRAAAAVEENGAKCDGSEKPAIGNGADTADQSSPVHHSDNAAVLDPSTAASAELDGALLHVKRERGARRSSSSSTSTSDDECEEEDRMREFKRHRHDVYERAEALQGNSSPVVKREKEPLSSLPGIATADQQKGEERVEGFADSAPRDGSAVDTLMTKVEHDVDAHPTLSRLGAVVRAADLLRDEAAAAAAEASTFAHVVSSSDESDVEVEKVLRVDTSNGGSAQATAPSLVGVAELEAPAVLSSVAIVVDRILANSSPSAAALVAQLSFVGAIDGRAFLAQVGTTLVWCDTMCLVRHAVFQRIFLRWGQPSLPAPSLLVFDAPLPLSDLLVTALAFDAPHLQPPTSAFLALVEDCSDGTGAPAHLSAEAVQRLGGLSARAWRQLLFQPACTASVGEADTLAQAGTPPLLPMPKRATRQYVRRLVRRLCRWRGLLKEYFFVDITADGLLLSLPHGLNRHWPPLLRALPLTMWRLAEAVPYPAQPPATGGESAGVAMPPSTPSDGAETSSASPSAGVTPAPTQSAVETEAGGVVEEVACFTAIAHQLADTLYGLQAPPPTQSGRTATPRGDAVESDPSTLDERADEAWNEALVQHGLFPCLKSAPLFRLPDQCLRDGTIQSMVSVESLYKVFERC